MTNSLSVYEVHQKKKQSSIKTSISPEFSTLCTKFVLFTEEGSGLRWLGLLQYH